MADAWDIKSLKTKRNTLREKLEKRKKERFEILSDKQEDQTNPKKELGKKRSRVHRQQVGCFCSKIKLILKLTSAQQL